MFNRAACLSLRAGEMARCGQVADLSLRGLFASRHQTSFQNLEKSCDNPVDDFARPWE